MVQYQEKGEAVLTLEAAGKYTGDAQIRVKWTPKKLIENARLLPGIYSEDMTDELAAVCASAAHVKTAI